MGSSGIGKIIRRLNKCIIKTEIVDYEGCVLVIDLLHWLYKFKISMITSKDNCTPYGKNISHIKGLFDKITNMLSYGIMPIFVIDGKPPHIKQILLNKRRKNRETAINKLKYDDYDNLNRIKLLKRSVSITENEINETKSFLDDIGVPYIQAMEEADPQCAGINIANLAYGVVSDDWDLLIFGSNTMITNFGKNGEMVEYNLKNILNELKLNHEQFVELAIVLGCDYCPPISCISENKTNSVHMLYYKYLECKNIDVLIDKLRRENKQKYTYKIPNDFVKNWKIVKQYYLEPNIYNPHTLTNFFWKCPKYAKIEEQLINDLDFNKKHVKQNLGKIKEIYKYYSSYNTLINFTKRKYDYLGYSYDKCNNKDNLISFNSKKFIKLSYY